MSKILLVIILFIINSALVSQTFNWVKHNAVPVSTNPMIAVFPSITDPSGSLVTASMLNVKVSFGSEYYGDVDIKKLLNSGSQLWSKTLSGKVSVRGVQTDASGNVYLFGGFMDTLIIDPGNILLNTGSGFNVNGFIIKLSAGSSFIWKKNITAVYGNLFDVNTIKVKGASVYAGLYAGNFASTVKKFDLSGNETGSFNQSPVRNLSSIDADASGNIYTAGSCQNGTLIFSNLSFNCPFTYSMYFAKYNSSFTVQWVKLVEDETFQGPNILSDNSGGAICSGSMIGNYLFDTIQTQGPHWVYDFFVAKIHSFGIFLWAREVPNVTGGGDADVGIANHTAVDNLGNVYVTGFQRGTINWGTFTTTGSNHMFVLKYSSAGTPLWGKTTSGSGSSRGHSISLDNAGNIMLSGNFSQNVQFDTISANTPNILNSFAAKLSNPPLGIISYNNNQPSQYSIKSYPNPFNPSTIISYGLQIASHVNLIVYDVLGNEIETLINEKQAAGTYKFEWNASGHPSGIYFVRLEAGNFSQTIRMSLVK